MNNISCKMPYFCKINHFEKINAYHQYRNTVESLLNLNSTASIITGLRCHVPQKLTLYDAIRYQFV